MMKNSHIIILAISAFIFSCSSENKQTEHTEEVTIEVEDLSKVDSKALYIEIDSLKKEAFASEQAKIAAAEDVLKYIKTSKVKGNSEKKEAAEVAIANAKTKVYTDANFNNNDYLMQYDQAINEMIFALRDYVETLDNLDVQEEVQDSIKEISDASGRDTFTRGYYNNAVKKWNKMIAKHKEKLQKENPNTDIVEMDYFYGESPL